MEKVGDQVEKVLQKLTDQAKQTGSKNEIDICKIHGIEKTTIPHLYEILCPKCVEIEEQARKMEVWCKSLLEGLSLPERLQNYYFENFSKDTKKKENAFRSCYSFALNFSNITGENNKRIITGGLVLIGGVGTGKTHLAVSICKFFCSKGHSAKMTTIPEIIRNIRSTWNKNKSDSWGNVITEESIINDYSFCELLVIDEIGSQYGSDSEKIVISEIVNNRYENDLPTVVVGNLTLKQMKDYLGERVVDRILHNGEVVVFDWESYRKKAE